MPTIEQAVKAYITLRDQKDALKKQQATELKPFSTKMDKIEAWLLRELNSNEAESIKTVAGTCYRSTRTSAKVGDWEEALAFIKEHELWSMLERRVSKAAVEDFIDAQGSPPPGVDIVQEVRVNVRR